MKRNITQKDINDVVALLGDFVPPVAQRSKTLGLPTVTSYQPVTTNQQGRPLTDQEKLAALEALEAHYKNMQAWMKKLEARLDRISQKLDRLLDYLDDAQSNRSSYN